MLKEFTYPMPLNFDPTYFEVEMPEDLSSLLDYYNEQNGEITLFFNEDLDVVQITKLNDFIMSHPNYKFFQIYNYIPSWGLEKFALPHEIDFITGIDRRLVDKKTRIFGELQTIEYFESKTQNQDGSFTFETPVVKESFSYVRDAITGFPSSRTQTIQWYFEDGSLCDKAKTRIKYYDHDSSAAVNELITVRKFNVLDIINGIIPLILTTDANFANAAEVIFEGQRFFEKYSSKRDLYETDGNYALTQAVKDEANDFTWLNNDISGISSFETIRSFIIFNLTNGAET